jgi:hypothetical protein
MPTVTLSEDALTLLRRRLSGERVEVTQETRPLYRQLVDAGMMIPLHSFALGPEGAYRLSDAACDLRDAGWNGLTSIASQAPSASAVPSPHG